jgi:hypothetical protein
MKRLRRKSEKHTTIDKNKKAKEINEAINYAQNFMYRFQMAYNFMVERAPSIKAILDVQANQIYQVMLDKLKRSLTAFNKSTITDKLNYILQTMMPRSEQSYNVVSSVSKKRLYKLSESVDVVSHAKQIKDDLVYIKTELESIYDQGEVLAEKTKKLLDYHAKNSVLKRIKNIDKVVRWLNNEDAFDTDIIGRLDKIIDGEIPKY